MRYKKKLVSCHQKADVAEQTITKINGDGGEHSHPEKRRVEGQIVKTPKKLVSCHNNASVPHAGHGKKTEEWDGRGAHSYTDGMDSPPAQKHKEKTC